MSRQLSELCTLLVDEFAGSLASSVFSVLVAHGSLSLPQIVHFSKVNPRHAKNALALLLQRQLVTHDESSQNTDRTHYKANINNAYRLIRTGKYIHLADAYLGKDAASIVQQTQERGFVTATELAEYVHPQLNSADQPTSAGGTQNSGQAPYLDKLFRSNYVVLARSSDLTSMSALKEDVEADIAAEEFLTGIVGTSKRKYFDLKVRSTLKRKRDDNQAAMDDLHPMLNGRHIPKGGIAASSLQNHTNDPPKVNPRHVDATEISVNGDADTTKTSKRRKLANTVDPEPSTEFGPKKGRKKRVSPDPALTSQTSKKRKFNAAGEAAGALDASLEQSNSHQIEESGLTNGQIISQAGQEEQNADPTTTLDSLQQNDISSNNLATSNHAEDQPFFRLSLEKFDVCMRSQFLVDLCLQCLGEPTSRVYAALLQNSQTNVRRCHDDLDSDDQELMQDEMESDDEEANAEAETKNPGAHNGVSAAAIASTLDPKVELYVDDAQVKDKATSTHGSTQNIRAAEIEHHLRILAEHEHPFTYPITVDGQERWYIDFPCLTALMIQREMQNIITTRFDGQSARIARILLAKGKMEEKYLANTSLIKQKDIRVKLALMQEAGFLDVQEVPRDASRQPSRTIYLWFFDQDRCRSVVLNDTYQMMARLLQRLRFERSKARSVLDKASRTDVVGREDELLNESEKAALRELERKEDKIWLQASRLDDTVAVLRDFT